MACCRLRVRFPGRIFLSRVPGRRTGSSRTWALAGHLVPAGSMFAFLAGHRAGLLPDEDWADLFAPAGKGRPSVPATQMAAVMTLQALHGFSGGETAEAVRSGVRWKAATGAAPDDPGYRGVTPDDAWLTTRTAGRQPPLSGTRLLAMTIIVRLAGRGGHRRWRTCSRQCRGPSGWPRGCTG